MIDAIKYADTLPRHNASDPHWVEKATFINDHRHLIVPLMFTERGRQKGNRRLLKKHLPKPNG